MNRNSVRNKPTPVAPESTAARASSGSSMFAQSSMRVPQSVCVGENFSRCSLRCSNAFSLWRYEYSSSTIGAGSTITMP